MKYQGTVRGHVSVAVLFGVCAAILTIFNIPMNWGNPNLGTLPVSLAGCLSPPASFVVGVIKGASSSVVTGRAYVEMAAGIGDGIMGVLTFMLARRYGMRPAVVGGQLSRLVITAGMVALSVAVVEHSDLSMLGTVWWDILPAIALSITANAIAALLVLTLWGDRVRSLAERFNLAP